MLRTAAIAAQAALLLLALYNLVTALPGWRNRRHTIGRPPPARFRVVIPAHDEGGVVVSLLDDLAAQDHVGPVTVWVVADRCTDDTATLARGAGASVDERTDGPSGKPAALDWHLERHPLGSDEALVVLDADNRIPPGFLSRCAAELAAGHRVLQAYLDVANPDASLLTLSSALSYWAGNRMVQLARTNVGWSSDLGGTGMCFAPGVISEVGGFGSSLTEDQDLAGRLALADIRVVWMHDVRLYDEKPTGVWAAVGQRARWMAGKREVARRLARALLRKGLRERRFGPIDHALRLVQPSRSLVVLLIGLLAVLAVVTRSDRLLPWPVLVVAAAVLVLSPLAFLVRDGVPARYLVRYPAALVLPVLWPVIRLASRRSGDWYHTQHDGTER
jgi:cellulose synthase/poly-beta-1,6-N-acetylglucosamine synthase-like glycosyltransferase